MVLVLCISDSHVPHRVADLPPKFKEVLKPGKIHSTLCCGNVCSKEFLDYLKTITNELHVVQGDFDDFKAPESTVLQIADFKVGIIHGHQVVPWGDQDSLAALQRQMDVDILVSGHTHEHKVVAAAGGYLHINPGSATGAYSWVNASVQPSFVLMDLDGGKATVYIYQLVSGEFKVEKIEYLKPAAAAAT